MRTVLYTMEMEPITIIDIPDYARHYLKWHGVFQMPVFERPSCIPSESAEITVPLRSVTIRANVLYLHDGPYDSEQLLLRTADEESALLLKCAFLPGQQGELNERERKAFAAGFCDALCKLGSM